MQKKTEDKHIKRMANLLRQGVTLTDLSCPACASPLFRLKDGTLWCAKDEKKVIVVKEGEELGKPSSKAYERLEATLLTKVEDIQNQIQQTSNVDELLKLGNVDPCGEHGEFHTFVTDGPIFQKNRIEILESEKVKLNGHGRLVIKRFEVKPKRS